MAKANTKSFELRTDVECAQKVTLVRDCINRSKDAAAEAVAIAYLLERGCQSGFAKLWLLTEFETRNAEIEEHNKQLSELFTEANRYVNEKLSKEHWLNQTPVDAVEAASQQERRDELKRIAGLESRDKNHMRMVRIEAREGSSRFTRLVKYLYNFDPTTMRQWFRVTVWRLSGSQRNLTTGQMRRSMTSRRRSPRTTDWNVLCSSSERLTTIQRKPRAKGKSSTA